MQIQFVALETKKFQMLKNQKKQENLIKELETKLASSNNVNKTELINMVKKSALLNKQYENFLVKNKFRYDIIL